MLETTRTVNGPLGGVVFLSSPPVLSSGANGGPRPVVSPENTLLLFLCCTPYHSCSLLYLHVQPALWTTSLSALFSLETLWQRRESTIRSIAQEEQRCVYWGNYAALQMLPCRNRVLCTEGQSSLRTLGRSTLPSPEQTRQHTYVNAHIGCPA